MSTVKELMLSPDGTSALELPDPDDVEPDAPDDELELDELQAAAAMVRTASRLTRPSRRKEREPQAPADLLPTLNPHIPSI